MMSAASDDHLGRCYKNVVIQQCWDHRQSYHGSRKWRRSHRPTRVVVRHVHPTRVIYRDTPRASAASVSPTFGGGLIGAVLGAALGTQFGKGNGKTAAIVTGGLVGAVLGGNIGASMAESDRLRSQRALETTPTSTPVAWRNPDSGSTYRVTPTKTYQTASGQYCRDYSTWAFIDGYEEEVKSTACRTPEGTWINRPNG
jgi:surface antigen